MDETLEEAFEKWADQQSENGVGYDKFDVLQFGAKWQQKRMYSEKEVVSILIKAYEDIGKRKIPNQVVLASWFEQFKKK